MSDIPAAEIKAFFDQHVRYAAVQVVRDGDAFRQLCKEFQLSLEQATAAKSHDLRRKLGELDVAWNRVRTALELRMGR
jgi:hypothetical protein